MPVLDLAGVIVLGVLLLYFGPATLYLAMVTVGSFGWKRTLRRALARRGPAVAPVLRIAVVVPAHNEELGIADCMAGIRAAAYPADRFTVFVIANNCTDGTAEVARQAGAVVCERHDLARDGKGQGLDWFLKCQPLTDYDAIVIHDADSEVSPQFMARVSLVLADPAVDVVQGYHGISNAGASWRTALTAAGFCLFNGLRLAGRSFFGGRPDLRGSGMAFRTEVLLRYGWPAHSAVEDLELSMRLQLDGVRIVYDPEAVIGVEATTRRREAAGQRRRWERGRFGVVRSSLPRMVGAFFRHRQWRFLDSALDLLVLPLTLHVLVGAVTTGLGLLVAPSWWPLYATGLALTVLYVAAGLAQYRAPLKVWLSLLAAPLYVLWKLPLYAAMLLRPGRQVWRRTLREAEPGA